MSTLNLKQYLAKIDALLEDEYYDEAIYHSRHVLSFLPKNLATYRRLGRAEVGAGRWDDANTTLRRILSFAPDDKIAHVGMSKVYQRAQKKEEALWHLERAYEQDPNNQEIIDELRDLYAAYKKMNNVRLQLTAGAVARQYAKNQLYPQAIKALKDALKHTPQRIDLRLALARVYRESGDIVAAAETALDVLDVLPDCLDANYIMTEVWLSEQRPSDAQRYLSAVEALDPYLAMRLAQNRPAPDDLIELPEADYKKAGQIISDQNPDWLNQLDDDDKIVDLGGGWSNNPIDDPTLKIRQDEDLLNLDLADDDLSWLDEPTTPTADEDTVVPQNSRKHTGLTGMLNKFDKEFTDQAQIPTEQINLEDLFNASDGEDASPSDDDDIMAWLTDATPENMTDDEPIQLPSIPHDKDDPMAWLKASGIEIIDDTLSEEMLNKTKAPTQALNPDDPMAWLKASGIEISDEPVEDVFTPYEKVESTTLKSPDEVDPMAWLKESGVELTDDEPLVKNFSDDDDFLSDAPDPMAWLKESGVELIDDDAPQSSIKSPTPSASSTSAWDDDSSFLDEMLSMEELTGQTDGLSPISTSFSSTPETDWQDTMTNSNDDFPSWLSDDVPSDDDEFSFDDEQADDTPDWLMTESSQSNFDPEATNIGFSFAEEAHEETDDDFSVSDDDTPDWLMDMKPAEQPVSADEFDFLDINSDDTVDDTPDWLMTESSQSNFDPEATNIGFSFAEEAHKETDDDFSVSDDDTPDWLMGMSVEDSSDTSQDDDADFAFASISDETPDDDDTPDWLMGMSVEDSSDISQDDDADFAFASISDETPDDDDTPDWLMGMSVEDSSDTSQDDDADFAFATVQDETPDDDDTPDWLMGMSVEDSSDTSQDDDADFAFATVQDETPDDDDTPDWLVGLSDDNDEAIAEETEFDFLSDELDDEALVAEDAPDWLMDARPEVDEKALDWLAEDDEPIEEETPSWLSALSEDEQPAWMIDADTTIGEFDETVPVTADMALTLGDTANVAHTPAENAPDWLNALVPGLDIDFDADEDAPIEQSFADSAAVASASANFGWLTAIVEAEVNQPPMTMPSASTIVKPQETVTPVKPSAPRRTWSFSRPPAWLNRGGQATTGIKPISAVQPQSTNTSPSSDDDFEDIDLDFDDDDDDDLPAWLRDDNDDEPDFLRDNF